MCTGSRIYLSAKSTPCCIFIKFILNIELLENKKILIKGMNGVGKSVFLKLLVGYIKIDHGEIQIDNCVLGRDVDFIKNAGVSISAPEFIKGMTGMENILYLTSIKKIVTKEDIMKYVKLFEMEGSINKKYATYSLGMKQKLRFIQAIIEEPQYLILDELFDALDKNSQKTMKTILDEYIKKDKNTIIFTSHNVEYDTFADIVLKIEVHEIFTCN